MSLEIIIDNRSGCTVDLAALEGWAEQVLTRLELGSGELGLALVDEDEMAGINGEFMGKEGPTDVLSFPMDAEEMDLWPEDGPPPMLGDIIICPQVAELQGAALGNTTDQELCLLLIHGLLHLAGYDHESDQGQMEARQTELFNELC